eukprot:TRINITY_DN40721_c0_g2_i1.p1 TRINITY_DN40721_c0_g2~~TRINITY_DN40721_c0_g2_i1.p1  ORF type:complete len:368 (+),score=93.50 TRINITY_DN40721_c0_g2_i1:45-1106(+)
MADFVRSWGLSVVDHRGQAYDLQQLQSSDVIAFYFSASWCPPCVQFTPLLKKFADTLRSNGDSSFKIIFCSGDKSEHDMWKYIYDKQGEDWLAIPFGHEAKERLQRHYQVSGIPNLVIVDAVGRSAVKAAVGDVWNACGGSGGNSTQVLTTYMRWRTAAMSAAPGGGAAAPQSQACNQLPNGAKVLVRGLAGAPEHNGSQGTIQGFDAAKQRYVVDLSGKPLSLRAVNLLQLLTVSLRRQDSGDQDALAEAKIVGYDEDSGELLLDTAGEALPGDDPDQQPYRRRFGEPDGPILRAGARVLVHGLQAESAQMWNEKLGEVLEFDAEKERYVVRVAPDSLLRARPVNLRLCPLG